MIDENKKDQLRETIKQVIKEQPDLFDSLMDQMLFHEDPAYYFLDKAIKLLAEYEDFKKAIPIINMGLNINDPDQNIYLYKLRGECKFNLNNNGDWFSDYQNAIDTVNLEDENRNELLSDIYIDVFELFMKVNDFIKAEEFINNALELANGMDGSFYNYECLKLRSTLYRELGKNTEADEDSRLSEEYERKWNAEEEANPSSIW